MARGEEAAVCVVGGGGFIGSRLVARLAAGSAPVRVVVRSDPFDRLMSSSAVTYVRGDVGDLDALSAAMRGCSCAVNCAWGGDTWDSARRINVIGAANVVEAAHRAGVPRLVHISTMAVHGARLPSVLTEDAPTVRSGDVYSVTKAEGELAVFETANRLGVKCVALRPTLVYGPGAPIWVLAYFNRVRRGQVGLIGRGDGLANLVHVDDLVDAILRAAAPDSPWGRAYLISGAQPVTWREYLERLAAIAGAPRPPALSKSRARIELVFGKVWEVATGQPRRVYGMDLALMCQKTAVSIERARRDLDYDPKVSLEAGLAECATWLYNEGYLPERVWRAAFADDRSQ